MLVTIKHGATVRIKRPYCSEIRCDRFQIKNKTEHLKDGLLYMSADLISTVSESASTKSWMDYNVLTTEDDGWTAYSTNYSAVRYFCEKKL